MLMKKIRAVITNSLIRIGGMDISQFGIIRILKILPLIPVAIGEPMCMPGMPLVVSRVFGKDWQKKNFNREK